jgi:hypothetical protein
MRKHKWKLIGMLTVGLMLLAVGGFVLWPRADRLARENYERVRRGMSRPEVEAILGPPGDYRTGPTWVNSDRNWDLDQASADRLVCYDLTDLAQLKIKRDKLAELEESLPDDWVARLEWPPAHWDGDAASIRVFYDKSGCVEGAVFHRSERVSQGPLDYLLRRAGRLWPEWFPEKRATPVGTSRRS